MNWLIKLLNIWLELGMLLHFLIKLLTVSEINETVYAKNIDNFKASQRLAAFGFSTPTHIYFFVAFLWYIYFKMQRACFSL